ncbi:MAG: exonuclease SbcCD subunit D, partial [Acidilobaceae archaeon]
KSPIRVALAHASLCDAFSPAEGIPESQCTSRLYSNLIRRGYTYVALGDLHTGWMGRLEDGTPIVYPGSTEYLGIDEYRRDPERSVYIVDIGGPGDVKLERVRLKSTRPWVIVEGNNVNSIIGSVHAGLERVRGKEPIVMVKVKGEISRIDRGKLVNELDKLKRNNKILYYNVDVEGGKLLFRPSRRHQPEVSLDDILKDIIKCDKAISLLKTFIEEPELAGKLVEELGRDGALLKCLEDSESSTRGVKLL